MNEQDAIACLANRKKQKPSEIGEAVDALYQIHKTYKKIATAYSVPPNFLSLRHSVFQLPKGIRWKVDEDQISIDQALQIAKLKREQDQWLLAITAVEKKLSATECKRAVDLFLKDNWEIKEALSTVTGVRFEDISPPMLMLPVGVDFWFALIQSAWERSTNFADLCYQLIREGVYVDNQAIATEIESIAKESAIQLESIAKESAAKIESIAKDSSAKLESIAIALRQADNQYVETDKDKQCLFQVG